MPLALRANAPNDSTWVDDIGGSTDIRPQLVLLRSITEPPSAPCAERDDEPHIVVHELAPGSAAALAFVELELAGRDEPEYGELPPSTYAPPPRQRPAPSMRVSDEPKSVVPAATEAVTGTSAWLWPVVTSFAIACAGFAVAWLLLLD